jgi:hypothetical protein
MLTFLCWAAALSFSSAAQAEDTFVLPGPPKDVNLQVLGNKSQKISIPGSSTQVDYDLKDGKLNGRRRSVENVELPESVYRNSDKAPPFPLVKVKDLWDFDGDAKPVAHEIEITAVVFRDRTDSDGPQMLSQADLENLAATGQKPKPKPVMDVKTLSMKWEAPTRQLCFEGGVGTNCEGDFRAKWGNAFDSQGGFASCFPYLRDPPVKDGKPVRVGDTPMLDKLSTCFQKKDEEKKEPAISGDDRSRALQMLSAPGSVDFGTPSQ